MRRRIGSMLLVLCMMAGVLMTGCGADNAEKKSNDTTQKEESSKDTVASDNSEQSSSGAGKILVAYYSATGTTKGVAEKIAEEINGELFELKPVEEYTDDDLDWTDDDSRVSREHEDESLRDVELTEVTPEDFRDVSVVILSYPVWWSEAAWPVNNFVKNNDFTGKTVIPFCTSASSGIGDSGKLLEEMAGTGNWQEGKRFASNANNKEIHEWADSLNLK